MSEDRTENLRRVMVEEINTAPHDERAEAESAYGAPCLTTTELQEQYTVIGFLAPFVQVTRKSDGAKGLMQFSHYPRWYFGFEVTP